MRRTFQPHQLDYDWRFDATTQALLVWSIRGYLILIGQARY